MHSDKYRNKRRQAETKGERKKKVEEKEEEEREEEGKEGGGVERREGRGGRGGRERRKRGDGRRGEERETVGVLGKDSGKLEQGWREHGLMLIITSWSTQCLGLVILGGLSRISFNLET